MTVRPLLTVEDITEPGRYSFGSGLLLNFIAHGKGSWILRVQTCGTRHDFGLGSLRTMTLAEARAAATAKRLIVTGQSSPHGDLPKAIPKTPSFRTVAETVHAELKPTWTNRKHQHQWLTSLQTYAFSRLADQPVSDIDAAAIHEVLEPIWLLKPETARRVLQRIATVLDWAFDKKLRDAEAPMRSLLRILPRQPTKKALATVRYQDVNPLIGRLRQVHSVEALALEAVVLLAARSAEVRFARWSELDLESGFWSIPAGRTKFGKSHIVPLAPQAISLFRRARNFTMAETSLVFPNTNSNKPFSNARILRVFRKSNSYGTVHGLRTAFYEWALQETSYPIEVVESILSTSRTLPDRKAKLMTSQRSLLTEWAGLCTTSDAQQSISL